MASVRNRIIELSRIILDSEPDDSAPEERGVDAALWSRTSGGWRRGRDVEDRDSELFLDSLSECAE